MVRAAVIGLVLAAIVLGDNFIDGGGRDGPCLDGHWVMRTADEGDYVHGEHSVWPPGARCVVSDYRTGAVLAERTFPAVEGWALALAAAVVPVGAAGLRRSLRRA